MQWAKDFLTSHRLKSKSEPVAEDKERLPRDFLLTLVSGMAGGGVLGLLTFYVLWHTPFLRPFDFNAVDPRVPGKESVNLSVLWILVHAFNKTTYRLYDWEALIPWMAANEITWRLNTIMYSTLLAGIGGGAWVGSIVGKGRQATRHMSGLRLFKGPYEAYQSMLKDIRISGPGIRIHPDVQISRDRETRVFLVTGSIGAGKTVTLWYLIQEIVKRMIQTPHDRIVLYDNKADFTAKVPVPDDQIALFAPWDARTYAWDVGKDVLNEVDGNELCQRLIPDSDDPFWSNAARQVLLSAIIKLQKTQGTSWSWKDLNREIGGPEKIADNVLQYNPVLASLYEDPSNKTAQSVNTTLATFAATIRLLTQAWDNEDPYTGKVYEEGRTIPRLSLREWALSATTDKRVLIFQGNKRYEQLEKGYVQGMLSALRGIVASPEMTDSKTRRVWIILDEFPQLGKLTGFSTFLEVGRSKGLCIVLGLQDMAQLREVYGRETAAVWESIAGTYIIGRALGTETIDWVKKLVGERVVRRQMPSNGGKGAPKYNEQESRVPVIDNEQIVNLGPIDAPPGGMSPGVMNLFYPGKGKGIHLLTWPYPPKTVIYDRRPASVEAFWTKFVESDQAAVSTEGGLLSRNLLTLFGHHFDGGVGAPPSDDAPLYVRPEHSDERLEQGSDPEDLDQFGAEAFDEANSKYYIQPHRDADGAVILPRAYNRGEERIHAGAIPEQDPAVYPQDDEDPEDEALWATNTRHSDSPPVHEQAQRASADEDYPYEPPHIQKDSPHGGRSTDPDILTVEPED